MRLATFNVENLDDRPGDGAPLEARIAALRPVLERLAPDILCLQEVNGQTRPSPAPGEKPGRGLLALEALLRDTPLAGFHRLSTEGPHGAFDVHNLVVLSRYPLLAGSQLRNDLVPPPAWRPVTADPAVGEAEELRWDRPLLHAVVDIGAGRPLHVVNLHLRAPLAAFIAGQKDSPFVWKTVPGWAEGFFMAATKRCGQALEARLLIDGLFDEDPEALVAVCGDFNADVREMPVRIIMGAEEDTGNGRLAGRALVALETTVPGDRRYSVIHGGRPVMLDHLLVSRSLMAWYRGAEIHNEALGDELVAWARIGDSPDSFHAPVVASFALPDPTTPQANDQAPM